MSDYRYFLLFSQGAYDMFVIGRELPLYTNYKEIFLH